MDTAINVKPQVVVVKPQFNTEVLKPGTAVRFTQKGRQASAIMGSYATNAIIVDASPLQLIVVYADGKKDDDYSSYDSRKIMIDAVNDGLTTVEILREA